MDSKFSYYDLVNAYVEVILEYLNSLDFFKNIASYDCMNFECRVSAFKNDVIASAMFELENTHDVENIADIVSKYVEISLKNINEDKAIEFINYKLSKEKINSLACAVLLRNTKARVSRHLYDYVYLNKNDWDYNDTFLLVYLDKYLKTYGTDYMKEAELHEAFYDLYFEKLRFGYKENTTIDSYIFDILSYYRVFINVLCNKGEYSDKLISLRNKIDFMINEYLDTGKIWSINDFAYINDGMVNVLNKLGKNKNSDKPFVYTNK